MSYGRYSDDLNEDSLFRDDEQRLLDETEEELRQASDSGGKGQLWAGLFVGGMTVLFLIWFFMG